MSPFSFSRRAMIAAAASVVLPQVARATSTYPSKPLRMIVPFPAGGPADAMGRIIAKPLGEELGQPIVFDNRPGAEGALAAAEMLRAEPDGHTLLLSTPGPLLYVSAIHQSKPPYDPIRDFAPISHFTSFTYVLVVHESLPVRGFAEFLEHVRKRPGEVAYGTGDATSILAMAQLAQAAKLDMVQASYKGGVQATADLATGRLQAMLLTPNDITRFRGKVRPLAVLLPVRSQTLPDVPTFAELGFPQVNVLPWSGFFTTARTPLPIIDRLSRLCIKIFERPDLVTQFQGLGMNLQGSTPMALADTIKTQALVWRDGVRLAKLPID